MTDDDLDRALAAAIAVTGVHRYRYLATGHPDPSVRAAYRDLVVRLAEGVPMLAAVRIDYGAPAPGPCGGCPPPPGGFP